MLFSEYLWWMMVASRNMIVPPTFSMITPPCSTVWPERRDFLHCNLLDDISLTVWHLCNLKRFIKIIVRTSMPTTMPVYSSVLELQPLHQCNGCNRLFSGCSQQKVGESGYAVSLWSASDGYSASMLTRGAIVLLLNFEHPRSTSLLISSATRSWLNE